ncbi:hypothetical protein QFZ91_000556 [Paraburkholderia sp. JPY419]
MPAALQRKFSDACDDEGALACCVAQKAAREALARLIADADRAQFADPRFRRELASWIHPRRRDDGMPAYGTAVGIATMRDDREAWLAAGQALERMLLVAASAGLTASYLNQAIEVDALRERLRTLLRTDAFPQLLLRVGRGPRVRHAPRRPLADSVS